MRRAGSIALAALALLGTRAEGQEGDRRALALPRPSYAETAPRNPIPAELQAFNFLGRLEAGDLAGASAALPRGISLGLRHHPERMARFGEVTEGCTRGPTHVSEFMWLERPRRPRAPTPASRLPPGHRIVMPGAPAPDDAAMALSSNWDCPGSKPDVVINFYLVADRIVRVAYELPPQRLPPTRPAP